MDEDYEDADFSAEDDLVVQDGPGLFDDPEDDPTVAELPSDELPGDELPVVDTPDEPAAAPIAAAPNPAAATAAAPRAEAPDAPLALYRRYRPETFDEVIGQDHVTEPLKRALINNRVNHAYLFSGPRGCGKTSSARILARALNCEQGPTPTPCGVCQSCRDLARGGSGSIDVIEIDAASHGGVEDARDLRERAFFAPASSRYKIYIVDEAHMVTTAGFNAMLKLVEEPPPHVKFIFATTEPEKVIGTIRSRTHHYPFRLVPPKVLGNYLGELCEAEGVAVDTAVLPLVVRAGAGSVRDSLSVLDQLLGGAAEDGVSYAHAASLLGYTPDSLLDEIMDAFAAGDSRGVFATIDKVVEVGQDPRRFGEDLLRRLRDLVIVAAVPDAISTGLLDVSGDQAERLVTQAAGMGAGELTRAAEVIAQGLTEMRGTTAPRLHLELMCSRVLLPGADVDGRGLHARLDRLERRLADTGVAVTATPPAAAEQPRPQWPTEGADQAAPAAPQPLTETPAPSGGPTGQSRAAQADADPAPSNQPGANQTRPEQTDEPSPTQAGPGQASAQAQPPAQQAPAVASSPEQPVSGQPVGGQPVGGEGPDADGGPAQTSQTQVPSAQGSGQQATGTQGPSAQRPSAQRPGAQRPAGTPPAGMEPPAAPTKPQGPTPTVAPGTIDVVRVRQEWPRVLDEVKSRRRFSWILLSQNAQVIEVRDGVLTLGFNNAGARDNFNSGGSTDVLADSLIEVIGAALRITAIVDGTPRSHEQAAAGRTGRADSGSAQQTAQQSAPAEPAAQQANPAQPSSPASAPQASAHQESAPSAVSPSTPPSAGPQAQARPEADGARPERHLHAVPNSSAQGDDMPPPDPADEEDGPPADAGQANSRTRPAPTAPEAPERPKVDTAAYVKKAKEQIRPMSQHSADPQAEPLDDLAEADDVVVDDLSESAADLITRQLGGTIIDEG